MFLRCVVLLLAVQLFSSAECNAINNSEDKVLDVDNATIEPPSKVTVSSTALPHPTAHPFGDKYDLHLSRNVYLAWGGGVVLFLIVGAVVMVCLNNSACPLYKQRQKKKSNRCLAQLDSKNFTPVIITVQRHYDHSSKKQDVRVWAEVLQQTSVTDSGQKIKGPIPYQQFK